MSLHAVGLTLLIAASGMGQTSLRYGGVSDSERTEQNEAFQKWWEEPLVWRYDDLPAKGGVDEERVPYSGYIYPDGYGGTRSSMWKYDRAFHAGRSLAASWEQRDIAVHQQPVPSARRGGLFGMRSMTVTAMGTPHWHGHCNGWTAAAIRHAPPTKSVMRNGVVFSPVDIKGLLAELYTYSDTQFLGGRTDVVNPGLFHVVIANWLGSKSHPVAMESSPGREVWNYPIYAYNTSYGRRSGGRQVDVRMNARYATSANRETDSVAHYARDKYFHYQLDLDDQGMIVGGRYYNDSARLDMMWVPLAPRQGGKQGNEPGNPYLKVEEVMALWRDSVEPEIADRWVNIDVPAPPSVEPPAAAPAAESAPAEETAAAAPPAGSENVADAPTATEGVSAEASEAAAAEPDTAPAEGSPPAAAASAEVDHGTTDPAP